VVSLFDTHTEDKALALLVRANTTITVAHIGGSDLNNR